MSSSQVPTSQVPSSDAATALTGLVKMLQRCLARIPNDTAARDVVCDWGVEVAETMVSFVASCIVCDAHYDSFPGFARP
jgi:hypothetical protein